MSAEHSRSPARLPLLATDPLMGIFHRLHAAFGPQRWWPVSPRAMSPEQAAVEIIVGAVLTQNTAWRNVERALEAMHAHDLMNWVRLRDIPQTRLAEVIRPSGTYRVKARRLKAFVERLWRHHNGDVESWLRGDLDPVRNELLSIPGIGPETADAILLYAGARPVFVVDAYTRRIMERHGLCDRRASYAAVQRRFQESLPLDVSLFNEYHGLLVELGKRHCRVRARCEGCPLEALPHNADAFRIDSGTKRPKGRDRGISRKKACKVDRGC